MLFYHLITIFLAPVFLLEGMYTRHKTPRLPEPEGIRSGKSGRGHKISLLLLGDSAAAGVGVAQQTDALSGRLLAELSPDYCVTWKLDANTGMRSAELIRKVRETPSKKFDYAVLSIGANDVTHGVGMKEWRENVQILLNLLENRFHVRRVFFASIPPMHRFPALPQPLRWWLGEKAMLFNRILEQTALKNKKCTIIKGEIPFEKRYMAEDGFHPSMHAYAIWAVSIAKAIKAEKDAGIRDLQS